jgi:hypothetical protein
VCLGLALGRMRGCEGLRYNCVEGPKSSSCDSKHPQKCYYTSAHTHTHTHLFNDTFNYKDSPASNDRMINEYQIGKDVEGSGHGLSWHLPTGTEKKSQRTADLSIQKL